MTKEQQNRVRWMENYKIIKEYFEEFGELPSKPIKYKDLELFNWINNQRHTFKVGKLTKERKELLDAIDPLWTISKKERLKREEWEKKYAYLQDYYKEFRGKPSLSTIYKNVKLGEWLEKQRKRSEEGKLSKEELNKINFLDPKWRSRGIMTPEKENLLSELLFKFDLQNGAAIPDAYLEYKKDFETEIKGNLNDEELEQMINILNSFEITMDILELWSETFDNPEELKGFREVIEGEHLSQEDMKNMDEYQKETIFDKVFTEEDLEEFLERGRLQSLEAFNASKLLLFGGEEIFLPQTNKEAREALNVLGQKAKERKEQEILEMFKNG